MYLSPYIPGLRRKRLTRATYLSRRIPGLRRKRLTRATGPQTAVDP
ncbi:MAG: hypothetical protein E7L08_28295 [Klebsiella michiganensis]|nr:hypothetical protein [Klebsiella michiganensis]